MSSLILRGKADLTDIKMSPVEPGARDEDHLTWLLEAEGEYRVIINSLAIVFLNLPESIWPWFFSEFEKNDEKIQEALLRCPCLEFREILGEFRRLAAEAKPLSLAGSVQDREWIIPIWSARLNHEVWFVYSEKEVDRLEKKGIPRGIIYTEDELKKTLKLVDHSDTSTLNAIDLTKRAFDAPLIGIEKARAQESITADKSKPDDNLLF